MWLTSWWWQGRLTKGVVTRQGGSSTTARYGSPLYPKGLTPRKVVDVAVPESCADHPAGASVDP